MSELATPSLSLRPQDEVECRLCEVHCDKVVYPSACMERSCPFVYAYEEHGHTFMGCMQKVYEVEIDVDMVRAAERRRVYALFEEIQIAIHHGDRARVDYLMTELAIATGKRERG